MGPLVFIKGYVSQVVLSEFRGEGRGYPSKHGLIGVFNRLWKHDFLVIVWGAKGKTALRDS